MMKVSYILYMGRKLSSYQAGVRRFCLELESWTTYWSEFVRYL